MLDDLLFSEIVKTDVVFERFGQSGERRKADDFAPNNGDTVTSRFHFDRLKDAVNRVFAVVGDVHCDLDDAFLFQFDSARFDVLEAAARLTDGARDLVRDVDIVRVKIYVCLLYTSRTDSRIKRMSRM